MKITVSRDVFTLDELSPDAQDKAIEHLCQAAWECLDSDTVSEYLAGHFAYMADGNDNGEMSVKQLKDKYRVAIYWQVGYSQSDNAQIDGILSRDYHPNLAWPDGIHTIRVAAGNYSWSYPTDVYGIDPDDGGEGGHVYCATLLDAAKDFVHDLCQTLYEAARDECESLCGKEYVIATYNDWGLTRRFNADGSVAPQEYWQD
ncbi:MAG: hypothetical protein FJ167_13450 [Gammaproteobacteria bacterium]|nr:hypothetical protein [Gammaproteobacteria bacterium]